MTTAAFEPSLDYCVVKYPRWDLDKFDRVEQQLGPQMRSVGEVMSIARDFTEGIQKAMRMVNSSWTGFEPRGTWTDEERDTELFKPTPKRIFAIADAFYNAGARACVRACASWLLPAPVERRILGGRVHKLTKMWLCVLACVCVC